VELSEGARIAGIGSVATVPPTAAAAFRTSLRRTLLSRRVLFAGMALSVVFPLMGLLGTNIGVPVISIIVPLFAVLAGIDGEGKTERFWVGMGGSSVMRELAGVTLDQVTIHALLGLAYLVHTAPEERAILGGAWLTALTLYALAGLTRSVASTIRGRLWALVIQCALFLGVAVVPHLVIGWLSIGSMLVGLSLGLSALGVLARVLLSVRWTGAGAAWRWWSPAWLVSAGLFLVSLPVTVYWPIPPMDTSAIHRTVDADGLRTRFPWGGLMGSAYLLRVDYAARTFERLPVRGVFPSRRRIRSAPSGAVAYEKLDRLTAIRLQHWASLSDLPPISPESDRARMASLTGDLKVGLLTPEGSVFECVSPGLTEWKWLDPDGRGLTALAVDGTFFRVDGEGCGATTNAPEGLPMSLIDFPGIFAATDHWRFVRRSGERVDLLSL